MESLRVFPLMITRSVIRSGGGSGNRLPIFYAGKTISHRPPVTQH
jgi:hypothetical protein